MWSSIHFNSFSSCSGDIPTAPRTPQPPAFETATTTSRQCEKATRGNSISNISQIGDFIIFLLSFLIFLSIYIKFILAKYEAFFFNIFYASFYLNWLSFHFSYFCKLCSLRGHPDNVYCYSVYIYLAVDNFYSFLCLSNRALLRSDWLNDLYNRYFISYLIFPRDKFKRRINLFAYFNLGKQIGFISFKKSKKCRRR